MALELKRLVQGLDARAGQECFVLLAAGDDAFTVDLPVKAESSSNGFTWTGKVVALVPDTDDKLGVAQFVLGGTTNHPTTAGSGGSLPILVFVTLNNNVATKKPVTVPLYND